MSGTVCWFLIVVVVIFRMMPMVWVACNSSQPEKQKLWVCESMCFVVIVRSLANVCGVRCAPWLGYLFLQALVSGIKGASSSSGKEGGVG